MDRTKPAGTRDHGIGPVAAMLQGCALVQGYLFSRPRPAGDVPDFDQLTPHVRSEPGGQAL
jgi:hypothetical protein